MKRFLSGFFLLLVTSVAHSTQPAVVQCTPASSGYFGSGGGGTLNWPNATTPGNGIIAFVAYNTTTTISVTDGKNTYSALGSGFPFTSTSGFGFMNAYFNSNILSTSSITLSISPSNFSEMIACEVTIQSASTMVEISGGGASAFSGSAATGSLVTADTALVFGFFINQSDNIFTPGVSWASQGSINATNSMLETFTQSSAGSISATATLTPANWSAFAVAIKPFTAAALSSIAVTPNPASVVAGKNISFTATGTFSDSSQFNLTGAAAWTSSNSTVAAVSNRGVATTITLDGGTSTITATYQGVSGNSVLTSIPATFDHFGGLRSIQGSGNPQMFTATCSQTGNTISITGISNPGNFLFAKNEPMKITNTGTAMDLKFVPNDPYYMPIVATVTPGLGFPPTSMTLTSETSQSITATPCTVRAGKFYIQTLTTPFGTGPQFVTPEDGWLWLEGIAAVGANYTTGVIPAKYGSAAAAQQNLQNEFQALNFNSIAPISDSTFRAGSNTYPSNSKIPYWDDQQLGLYSSKALGGFVSQPIKNIRALVNSHYSCSGANHNVADFFDPRFLPHMEGFSQFFDNTTTLNYRSPYHIGHTGEDTDFNGMPNAGWQFHTIAAGVNDCDYAIKVLVSSPMVTIGNYGGLYGGGQIPPVMYFDPLLYAKVPSGTSPSNCSIANPCSLSDFLQNKYSSVLSCAGGQAGIVGLNNCWGATYDITAGNSGFGSTGSGVGYTYSWLKNTNATPDTLCTGIGIGGPTSCAATLSTGSEISGFSLQIILTPNGGSPQIIGGDCPTYAPDGGCGGSSGVGTIKSCGRWNSAIAYPNGQCITDSNGDIEILTTAGFPAGTSGNSTPAWPTSANCTGTQTTNDGTTPLVWKCLGTGISSGTITYATRAVNITLSNPLAIQATYKANYVADGWGTPLGAGLLDEDGRHTGWVGTDYMCVVTLPGFQANHVYARNAEIHDTVSGSWQIVTVGGTSGSAPIFSNVSGTAATTGGVTFQSIGKPVCGSEIGSDFGPPNGNQNLAQDVAGNTGFASNFAGVYFKSWNTMLRTIYPGLLYGCADDLATWSTPPRIPVLNAAQTYCDWAYESASLMDNTVDIQSTIKWNLMTQYFTKPLVNFMVAAAREGPAACGGNLPCYDTQQQRGQHEYLTLFNELNTLSYTGTFQHAGFVHWTAHDFSGGQNANFGIKGSSVGPWLANFAFCIPVFTGQFLTGDRNSRGFILDVNGNLEQATTCGTSANIPKVTVSSWNRNSNVVTVTTTSAHGVTNGNWVIITGTASGSATNINGTWLLSSGSGTTFTFSQNAANDSAGANGVCGFGGGCAAGQPSWNSTCNGTQLTNDGTIQWTCLGFWIQDNLLDGNENVSSVVPCSPPLQLFLCGGQPANYPYNGKTMFSGTQNLQAGLALWFSTSSSLTPLGVSGSGIINGIGIVKNP